MPQHLQLIMDIPSDSLLSSYPSEPSSPSLLSASISPCFSNRSFSGLSNVSSHSSQSTTSGSVKSAVSNSSRRRGYVRPQGASFAPSAMSRESVMSLGSIAHLQYYFARTGLLDGKGGQLARKNKDGQYEIPKQQRGLEVLGSPVEEEGQLLWEAAMEDGEEVMLPPTVSTYCHRSQNIAPPPEQKALKAELVEALENALQALESCEKIANDPDEEPTQGFYELQGLHILDTATNAIRAARLYYTSHPNPKRINSIRSDQQIRKDLYGVMDVLKNCAGRNFLGGVREDEKLAVLVWVSEVGMMIDQEAQLEENDKKERQDWLWMDERRWQDGRLDRDIVFIQFLLREAGPNFTRSPTMSSSEFFKSFADGKDLIRAHNSAVKKSKKPFGQIDSFHEDVKKPYRRADNLRYWLKSAELRWETKLKLDALAVVSAEQDSPIWTTFEEVVRAWAQAVRMDLTQDWGNSEERQIQARARSLAMASPYNSPSNRTKTGQVGSTTPIQTSPLRNTNI